MATQTQTGLADLGIRWGEPDPEAMAAIRRSGVATKLLRTLQREMREELRERMREILLEGVQLGLNPMDVAVNLRDAVGQQLQATQARLNNIARTEQLDAYRAAGQASAKANTDVVTGWLWMSVLGENTCPSCIAMHGSEHPNDERGPDDHPQGRCYRMPVTKSWADLGFTGIEEPPSLVQNNEQWFNNLSPEVQKDILGPSRYDAWRGGSYPMSTWSKEVQSDEWRRSFQVARPGEVVARR